MESDDSDIGDMLDDLLANGDTNVPPAKPAKKLQELNYNFLDSQQEKIVETGDEKTRSLVHEKDADSSDEEDRKNFEDQKYSEYGRSLKNLLKNKEAPKTFEKSSKARDAAGFDFNVSKTSGNVVAAVAKDVYSDPVFGLRMTKPLISSAELVDRMKGRTAITISKVKNHVKSANLKDDWAIAGVLISHSGTKMSQKGTPFCVWKLSDLSENMNSISVFVFSGAYKLFWKTTTGVVIGIVNPTLMDSKNQTDDVALSVDNAQRIMILGTSRDMGKCKSTKKNGEPCSNLVNISRCEYCVYHVKQEYKQASKRSDLQSNGGPGNFASSMTKKPKAPLSGIYAQNVNLPNFTPVFAKTNVKLYEKDSARLALLRGTSSMPDLPLKQDNTENKKKACMVELTRSQMKKDLEKLTKLRAWNNEKTIDFETISETSKIDCTKKIDETPKKIDTSLKIVSTKKIDIAQKMDKSLIIDKFKKSDDLSKTDCTKKIDNSPIIKRSKKILDNLTKIDNTKKIDDSRRIDRFKKIDGTKKSDNSPKIDDNKKINNSPKIYDDKKMIDLSFPRLGLGMKGGRIDFSQPITKRHKEMVRGHAERWFQENGDIKQSNPNQIRTSVEKRMKSMAKRRRENDEAQEEIAKKSKTSEFNVEFKKMLEMKSAHVDLVEKSQDKDKEEYFEKLAIKERMEEKMLETYKIDCKAVKCLICKYTAFSASDLCKTEKHPLRVIDAVKSFFKCQDCGNRTVSLDRMPSLSCKKCSGSRWIRTAMMAEKKIEISAIPLSIRGGEEKFIGSSCHDANINLLVPDT